MLAGIYELASQENGVHFSYCIFQSQNQVLNDVYHINSITIVYLIFLVYDSTKDVCTYLQTNILTIYAIFIYIYAI